MPLITGSLSSRTSTFANATGQPVSPKRSPSFADTQFVTSRPMRPDFTVLALHSSTLLKGSCDDTRVQKALLAGTCKLALQAKAMARLHFLWTVKSSQSAFRKSGALPALILLLTSFSTFNILPLQNDLGLCVHHLAAASDAVGPPARYQCQRSRRHPSRLDWRSSGAYHLGITVGK